MTYGLASSLCQVSTAFENIYVQIMTTGHVTSTLFPFTLPFWLCIAREWSTNVCGSIATMQMLNRIKRMARKSINREENERLKGRDKIRIQQLYWKWK